ncbi:hypothetical protein EVAR_61884_1 [Eumeta japonica]|uniref:Uncharacterized protein n=1 Tax=Eumeta variegata TaxID=151549 RepID=A0A4C1YZG2_EUMVA|nr:hypothetical protein EVAR_61884_1 [Eumeta japonica]
MRVKHRNVTKYALTFDSSFNSMKLRLGVTYEKVTLGNVTMSHRTREARRMPCVSLPLNYDRSAARSTRELVHSLQMYCKLLCFEPATANVNEVWSNAAEAERCMHATLCRGARGVDGPRFTMFVVIRNPRQIVSENVNSFLLISNEADAVRGIWNV